MEDRISGGESLVFGGDKVNYILSFIHKVYRRFVTSLSLYLNMCANVMGEHSANVEYVSVESGKWMNDNDDLNVR